MRDGPALLSHLGPEFRPYLTNFLLLRKMYLAAKSWQITPLDLTQLRANCKDFVRMWQELYYRDELARLKVCKINLHALLHLGTYPITCETEN